jgi:hypothetical protein
LTRAKLSETEWRRGCAYVWCLGRTIKMLRPAHACTVHTISCGLWVYYHTALHRSIVRRCAIKEARRCLRRSNSAIMSLTCLTFCWHIFWGANHFKRTSGGALWSGADGPRHRAGRSVTWREAAVLSGQARTVRGLAQELGFHAWRPDGPRVRRGGGGSPAAPGSRSREGPRRGVEILGGV